MLTKHALKRCQQRSIPKDLCDLVLNFGEYRYDKHGARIWFLTKKTLNKIDKAFSNDVKKKIEKKKNLFVVESIDNNSVITVGYSYKASKFIGRTH